MAFTKTRNPSGFSRAGRKNSLLFSLLTGNLGRENQNFFSESSRMVTGPSFTSDTFIMA
jgi:hypothetical protein